MNVIPQRVKDGFVRLMGPLARGLIQAGVPPNTITTLGTLVVLGSGLAFGTGSIRLGGLLLLVSGVFDILDGQEQATEPDRKSTRLNSSHPSISYAVFCLKKKNKSTTPTITRKTQQHSTN